MQLVTLACLDFAMKMFEVELKNVTRELPHETPKDEFFQVQSLLQKFVFQMDLSLPNPLEFINLVFGG